MRFHIRPGKVTCAGVVAIFLVLPNSIWKGADAKDAPMPKSKLETIKQPKKNKFDSRSQRVKVRQLPR